MELTHVRRGVWVLALSILVALARPSAASAAPTSAARLPDRQAPDELPQDPRPGEGISVAVSAVPASSSELDAAEVERERLLDRQEAATEELGRTVAELASVDAERGSLAQLVTRRDAQIVKASAAHEQLRADLRAVAVEWFITGFDQNKAFDPTLSEADREQLERGRVLAEAAAEDTIADERYTAAHLAVLSTEREQMDTRRQDLDAHAGDLAARRDRLSGELADLGGKLTTNEQRVAEARMTATIDGTDLSTAALDAYWRAAQALAVTDARCGVPWWALAGIGRTESRHGTYRGASVGRDGTVSPPIYGPELDGSNTFRVVPDSDGGALDATSATDRAVGPMQFLPSTWRVVGRDGSGDGVADPQNLYDAALSAGVYLCRSGPGLGGEGPLRAAYLTYNRSLEYVDVVLDYAEGYREAVPLPT